MEIEINRIDASLRKRLILQLLGGRSTAILAIKWTLCCVPKPFSDRARASHLRPAPFTRQRFRLLSIRNIPGDTGGSADELSCFHPTPVRSLLGVMSGGDGRSAGDG
jgi:hypothetical protein